MDTTLIVPNKIALKYRYLLTRFPSTEWSGPAWYRIKTDKEGFPEEFKLVHFHPLDLGHGTATEWEAKDLAKILRTTYEKYPSLKKCYMGLIHSHHTMGAFLSGTDQATVQEMAPKQGFYGSLVVASSGKATEAFGFGYKDQYGASHCLEIDNKNIEIKTPEYKVEDDWKKQADIIEKNKPVAISKQMTINGTSYVPYRERRKQEILDKKPQNMQREINKLLDLNIEGKLDEVQLEAKLEKLGLSADEIIYVMDDWSWTNDNYGYGYGGYYGKY